MLPARRASPAVHRASAWDFWGYLGQKGEEGGKGRQDPSEEEDMLWSALAESPEKSSGLDLFLSGVLMNPGHWG